MVDTTLRLVLPGFCTNALEASAAATRLRPILCEGKSVATSSNRSNPIHAIVAAFDVDKLDAGAVAPSAATVSRFDTCLFATRERSPSCQAHE